jgi:hypothetical protein
MKLRPCVGDSLFRLPDRLDERGLIPVAEVPIEVTLALPKAFPRQSQGLPSLRVCEVVPHARPIRGGRLRSVTGLA